MDALNEEISEFKVEKKKKKKNKRKAEEMEDEPVVEASNGTSQKKKRKKDLNGSVDDDSVSLLGDLQTLNFILT